MAPSPIKDICLNEVWVDLLLLRETARVRRLMLFALNEIYALWREKPCSNGIFDNENDPNGGKPPVRFEMEFHYSAAATCAASGFAKSVQLETASNGFRMDGMIDYGKRLKSGLLAFLQLAMDFAIGHLSSPQKNLGRFCRQAFPKPKQALNSGA